ncbi:MAG TPA: hypothetical protein VFU49_12830 [Ktedonobacteraceae bacterium]|nr:hypothetical protein [Ktedonobacteraceae bacterium]
MDCSSLQAQVAAALARYAANFVQKLTEAEIERVCTGIHANC